MASYSEKLKDPRWQQKRLKVLERDNWRCKLCGDKKTTLNVHHIFYLPKTEPWNVPLGCLITVCENCHINTPTDENGDKPVDVIFEQIDVFLYMFWSCGYSPIDLISLAIQLKEIPKNHTLGEFVLNCHFLKKSL